MNAEEIKDKLMFIHNEIEFDEDPHIYTYQGKQFKSVTNLIGKYSPFDRDGISKRMAERTGKSQEEILKEWDGAATYGTLLHKFAEDVLQGKKPALNGEHTQQKRQILKSISILKSKYKYILPEVRVFNKFLQLAGTIDLIGVQEDGSIDILDWKTNKKGISKNGYNKYFEFPLNNLEKSKHNGYALQLSIYQRMLELWKLKINNLSLIHINEDYNFIPCDYLKSEAYLLLFEKARVITQRGQ